MRSRPALLSSLCLLLLALAYWFQSKPSTSPTAELKSESRSSMGGTGIDPLPDAAAGIFEAFDVWLQGTLEPGPAVEGLSLEHGVELAERRRSALAELMRKDPEAALEHSLSRREFQQLPQEIRSLVEQPFSRIATLQSLPACDPSTGGFSPPSVRVTFDDGSSYPAHVYGRRTEITSKDQAPLQGFALGQEVALWESPLQPVEASDLPLLNPDPGLSLVSGTPLPETPTVAEFGGRQILLKDETELLELDATLLRMDAHPGPRSGSGLLLALPKGTTEDPGIDLDELLGASQHQASSWTETPKDVFIIRVDFPNHTSTTYPLESAASLEQTFDGPVDLQIQAMSYNKTSIECTVSTAVIRLTNPTTTYTAVNAGGSSKNDLLRTDAIAAYSTANPGWNSGDYDIIGVYFGDIGMFSGGLRYGGLAGGSDLWLQDSTSITLITHELGHNYGLGHSSFWTPPGGSLNPVDPGGTNAEYGDDFDIMGDGNVPNGHFHAQAKQRLNWVENGQWIDVSAAGSGRYRLYRVDDPATVGTRGLRILKGSNEYYWLSHRRLYPNPNLASGACLHWQRPSSSRSWLLDATPGSAGGKSDAGLPIGSTYSDGNTHITPLEKGGTGAQEWLDVQVNLGPFPGNQAPAVTISGPTTLPARSTALFSAAATDPDGDDLSYRWDFGDGVEIDNHAAIPYAWTLGGTFTVTVTVSDMKGQTTTDSITVTVTDPINTWSTTTTGKTVNWTGAAQNGSRAVLVGEHLVGNPFNGAWAWSTNGTSWTSGDFGNNEHMADVIHDGSQFIAVGEKYRFEGVNQWQGLILTSTNGSSWTQRRWAGAPINAIVQGNGKLVALAEDGSLLSSTNGTSWTSASGPVSSGKSAEGLAFGNGTYVLTARWDNPTDGFNGGHEIFTSPDAVVWTDRSSGTSLDNWQDLRHTAFIDGRFFSSGFYSRMRISEDNGQSFTFINRPGPEYEEIETYAFGNGVYLAAGLDRNFGPVNNIVLASQNGDAWTSVPAAVQPGIQGSTFFQNRFILVGANDLIQYSAPISAGASGYIAWREANHPDRGAASAVNGDGDFDSLRTLVEYGLGTSPLSGAGVDGVALAPIPSGTESDPLLAGRLTLCFTLPNPAPADIRYTVEASSSVAGGWTALAQKTGAGPWQWLAGGTARVVTTAGARETVKVADSVLMVGSLPRFLHLKVEIAPPAP